MIRPAAAADAHGIASAHVASWRAAYAGLISQEDLESLHVDERALVWRRRLGDAEGATWVAEDDGAVAGFCHLRPSEDPDDDPAAVGEIAMLYLVPSTWGKGYGAALLATALEHARARFATTTLWVLEGNERARHFYEAGGWRDDGGRKDCFGGVSAPAMRYRLPLTAGVRAARPDDGLALAAVNIASWHVAYRGVVPNAVLGALDEARLAEEWAREATESEEGPEVRLWVAESDGRVVGYCRTGPTREADLDPGATGEVYGLYLDPAAFGTSTAPDLFAWATGDLIRRGYRRAVLRVVETNGRARRFYEKQGWNPDESAPDKPFYGAPQVRYSAARPG